MKRARFQGERPKLLRIDLVPQVPRRFCCGANLGLLRLGRSLALLALILVLISGGIAETVKRLILTDGSYQTATEWKQEGDRVRYFSAERGEWEEIPAALVDWKGTEEWNAQAAKSRDEDLKQVTGEEVAARKDEMLNNPQVAPAEDPNLRLPPEGGVFLLLKYAGKPELRSVLGTKTDENNHEEANRLKRSVIPLASQTQTIELKGAAAKTRVKSSDLTVFVDVDNPDGPIPGENFRIVRLNPKHDVRVLARNKIGLGGEQSTKESFVRARTEKFRGDWWKLTPMEPLAAGEYAVVIVEGVEDSGEGLVWDFGIDR